MNTTLSTALSALNANSTAVSVVGNDLSNLNTTGYKTTQIAFQDLMAESLGGINGYQLGMGTARPQTIRQFTQGGLQTGLGGLNAAIQGQGFFMVKNTKGVPLYTRDGSFTVGTNGYLVDANGLRVQGWTAGTNGVLNTNAATGDIPVPSGTLFPPVASSNVTLSLNLNSAAIAGTTTGDTSGTFSQPIKVFDSLGTVHTLTATFTKYQVEDSMTGGVAAYPIASGETADFTLSTASGTATISVDSADGTVDGQVAELNNKLQPFGITASLDSTGQLQFTSANAFSLSGTSSNAANLVPGTGTAATAYNQGLNNQVLTPGGPGPLTIKVGGTTVTVAMTGTVATDQGLINDALKAKGITGVTAVYDESTMTPGTPPTYTAIQLQGQSAFDLTDSGGTLGLGAYTGAGSSNTWDYEVTMAGSDLASGKTTTVAGTSLGGQQLVFDPKTGLLQTPTESNGMITLLTGAGPNDTAGALANGAVMNDISWNLYDSQGNPLATQVDQSSAVSANSADGSAAAQLTQVLMGDSGQLLAQFSNGRSVAIGQLSIANIPNPNSMITVGNNDFEASSETAAPIIGIAGTGGRGNVVGGALEQSTVDIAQEFSQLITLQNAYQANSRVVTTENQILQQTVGLVQP
jgi:flagellar hook protein FlgE